MLMHKRIMVLAISLSIIMIAPLCAKDIRWENLSHKYNRIYDFITVQSSACKIDNKRVIYVDKGTPLISKDDLMCNKVIIQKFIEKNEKEIKSVLQELEYIFEKRYDYYNEALILSFLLSFDLSDYKNDNYYKYCVKKSYFNLSRNNLEFPIIEKYFNKIFSGLQEVVAAASKDSGGQCNIITFIDLAYINYLLKVYPSAENYEEAFKLLEALRQTKCNSYIRELSLGGFNKIQFSYELYKKMINDCQKADTNSQKKK